MATRMQQRRGTAAQWISTNSGNGPILNAGEIGFETDTNKFKIGDGTNHWVDLSYFSDVDRTLAFTTSLTFEGATADSYETVLQVTDPTADRTITLPDNSGTVALTSDIAELSQDAIDSALTAGTGITKTYNDSANTLTLAVDTTAIQAKVSGVSDTEIGYLDGVTSAIQTQINAKAPLASPTFTGTVTLPSGTVTSTMILDGTIATADIADSAVTSAKIADGTIVAGDIADGAITSAKILDGTIATADIADSAVTSAKIANDTIVNADINSAAAIALSKLATDPLARANHTGSQTASTISDFNEAAQDAVGTILGTGLTYNDASNTITVDSTNIQLRVAGVSDTEIGYLDGVTSAIQTQMDAKLASATASTTYAPLASPTFTGTVSAADLTLSGNLTVNGTTTTINSTTLSVDDKNVVLGDIASPTDVTADGGGITLKGTTDKTLNWVDATDAWTSSEHINVASGKSYYVNGTLLQNTTETLTNKTVALGSNTVSGTIAQFNTAVTDADLATIAGTETLTNKTLTSPTLTTPALGVATATSVNGTTIPTSKTLVVTTDKLSVHAATTSAELAGIISDETGSGALVFATSPTLVTPVLGTPTSATLTNATGLPLTTGVTGTLPIANGGTGATTASTAAAALLPSQTSNSGKYLTTDGSGTLSWGTVTGYSAPTLGSTSVASGATVTTIAGLTLSGATLTGTLTANSSAGTSGQVLSSTGSGLQWITPSQGAAFSEFMLIGA